MALVAIAIPLLGSDGGEAVDVGTNSIARMNAEEGSLDFATPLGQRPGASAIGFGSVWVAEPDRDVVVRLDLEDGSVTDTIPVGVSPSGVAIGAGAVWVTNAGDGTVRRINVEYQRGQSDDPLRRIGPDGDRVRRRRALGRRLGRGCAATHRSDLG